MNLDAINKVTKGKTNTKGISPFSELELKEVYPNPNQPRKDFTGVSDLAWQIKETGLLQPIVVVKRGDRYMIVSGERRYHAHVLIDAKTIKAHIIDADDHKIQELALIENIQREDLTAFETAKHIVKLWSSGKYAHKSDLSEAIGKPPSYISKCFKAINLCDEIIQDLEKSKRDIGLEILQELSSINDKNIQLKLYTTCATREEIRGYKNDIVSPAKKYKTTFFMDNELFEAISNHHNITITQHKQYKITIEEI